MSESAPKPKWILCRRGGKWHEIKPGVVGKWGYKTWGCGYHEAREITEEAPPVAEQCQKCLACRERNDKRRRADERARHERRRRHRPQEETRIPVVITLPDGEELPSPLPRAFELRVPRPAAPAAVGRVLQALPEFVTALGDAWGIEAGCYIILSQAQTADAGDDCALTPEGL